MTHLDIKKKLKVLLLDFTNKTKHKRLQTITLQHTTVKSFSENNQPNHYYTTTLAPHTSIIITTIYVPSQRKEREKRE